MDGFRHWQMGLVVAIGLVLLGAANAHADEVIAKSANGQAWDAMVERLLSDWEEVREGLTQSAVEAAVTMFFIKLPSAPPGPLAAQSQGDPPPTGNGDDSSGSSSPPPPPADGSGEDQSNDPGTPPPLSDAPEPASLVTALLGVGLMSVIAWRRRRKRSEPEA